jgi:hypothetical protein
MGFITPLSAEGRIRDQLIEFGCTEHAFVKISGVVGRTRLAQGLSNIPAEQKNFEPYDAERMLQVLDEMLELQTAAGGLPIRWEQTDKIVSALVSRRMAKIEKELKLEDDRFAVIADRATKEVTTNVS